jgi:hypothetical protein
LATVRATHRAGNLELSVLSASVTETYTVLGSEDFTAHVRVRLTNRGTQPLSVDMNSIGAMRPGIAHATAVYFNAVNLAPGASANVQINIPAGLSRVEKPTALVYSGVTMDL